jgi:hypothetical protein
VGVETDGRFDVLEAVGVDFVAVRLGGACHCVSTLVFSSSNGVDVYIAWNHVIALHKYLARKDWHSDDVSQTRTESWLDIDKN